jgi:hypothetical protein
MRPSRALSTTLLLASLAVAGCASRGAPATTARAAEPTATTTTTAGSPVTTTTATPPATAAAAPAAACAFTRAWRTGPRRSAPSSAAPLYLVRAGRHACYDRVVLDVNAAAAVGYAVGYATVVREDGSGTPVPVAGGAALEVVIHAPAKGHDDQGHQPGVFLARPGQDFYSPAQLAGWRTLREVRYAGSFEGQTTIAVGVRARVPFRVLTVLDARDQVMRVILDVAH